MDDQGEKKQKHINKFEWGFVFGVFVLIDVIQFVVEWFDLAAGAGVVINRIISVLAGLLLACYYLLLKIRGATIDMRAWMSVFFAVLGELMPIISAFPLFSMDIAYVWSLNSKSVLAETTNVAMNAGLKGGPKGAPKAPPESNPPVIETYGKTPSKIPDGRQPLPRRIPQEPGVGE